MSIKNLDDRRAKRTKQDIQLALLSLLEEMDLASITVKDITSRAGINRATFYSHYEDKLHMIRQIGQEIFQQLELSLTYIEEEKDTQTTLYQAYFHLFKHVEDNYYFYKVILNRRSSHIAYIKIIAILTNAIEKQFALLQLDEDSFVVPKKLLLSYMTNSIIGLISYWVENDLCYSARYMTEQFMQLTIKGPLHCAGYSIS